jgi:pyruvate/2-oxoglutarate/acetoin dehydrogenase E1 component
VVRPAVKHLQEDHGIDVELIDVRTLRPLDVDTIAASIKKTNRCVIVDEDWGYCGMGSGDSASSFKSDASTISTPRSNTSTATKSPCRFRIRWKKRCCPAWIASSAPSRKPATGKDPCQPTSPCPSSAIP